MELILQEGRAFGSRYYTVLPKGYTPNWDNQTWNTMVDWCTDTYGPTPSDGVWTPNARWYVNDSKFWFREHKDLEWFMLRWS